MDLVTRRGDTRFSHHLDQYVLLHKQGSVKVWTTEVQDSVFMDLEVPDLAHNTRVLWGLFDDSDMMGKTTLKKLEYGHGVKGPFSRSLGILETCPRSPTKRNGEILQRKVQT